MDPKRREWIVRGIAAVVCAVGAYCLFYHLTFYSLWAFLFGKEVWPWPRWSLYLLVILPSLVALAAGGFLLVAQTTRRNYWIALGITAASVFGLLRYAAEVFKCMFQLGFRP